MSLKNGGIWKENTVYQKGYLVLDIIDGESMYLSIKDNNHARLTDQRSWIKLPNGETSRYNNNRSRDWNFSFEVKSEDSKRNNDVTDLDGLLGLYALAQLFQGGSSSSNRTNNNNTNNHAADPIIVESLTQYYPQVDVQCSICQTDIPANSTDDPANLVIKMPCCHEFHATCLHSWLKMKNTCPSCRYPLLTKDEEYNRTKVLPEYPKYEQELKESMRRQKMKECAALSITLADECCLLGTDDGKITLPKCNHTFHKECYNSACSIRHLPTLENKDSTTLTCPLCKVVSNKEGL